MLLAPAIDVAREGFVVDQTFFDQTQAERRYFDDIPSTAALYLDPDGTPRDVGARLRNPDMARAYELHRAASAPGGFYRGPIARAIVDAAAEPAGRRRRRPRWRPGLMTSATSRATRASERKPTHVDYRGSTSTAWGRRPPAARPSARR